jgi:hypothetical protein
MIRSDHSASAGHVLDDDRGVAGNVFRHILTDEPRPRVVRIAGKIPSHDSDSFTLKKERLSMNGDGTKEKQNHY